MKIISTRVIPLFLLSIAALLTLGTTKVSAAPISGCVEIFEHTFYDSTGASEEFCLGDYDSAALANWQGKISAVQVGPDTQITLYVNEDNTGSSITFYKDQMDFNEIAASDLCPGKLWNDCAKSISIASDTGKITKKVFLIIIDPTLENGELLHSRFGWNDPLPLSNDLVSWFDEITFGKINFEIVQTQHYNNFTPLEDGYLFDEESFTECWFNRSTCHEPSKADYLWMIDNFDICEKANAGQLDEVWVHAYPFTGMYESVLTGPNGYFYNGPTYPSSCDKLVPIMGFNYERTLTEMVHDYGHRTESTMVEVYGSWGQNRMAHNFDKFALVAKQSPAFNISGCGTTHFTPNSIEDYDYSNSINVAQTYCDEFFKYPQLPDNLASTVENITCYRWGCTSLGFFEYMFQRIPAYSGIGPDGVLMDWWQYIMDPNMASQSITIDAPDNLAKGKPVIASGIRGNAPDITDGKKFIEGARSNAKPVADYPKGNNYTIIDLQGVYDLSDINIQARGTSSFYVFAALDRTNWKLIATVPNLQDSSYRTHGLDVSGTYRYIKISSAPGAVNPAISEVEVYGTSVSNVCSLTPGLKAEYYALSSLIERLPNFYALTPYQTTVLNQPIDFADTNDEIANSGRSDSVAIRYTGRIKIAQAGEYEFHLRSDDGSKLYIGSDLVIDHDGWHGADELSRKVTLTAGTHYFRVEYFERDGGAALNLRYTPPRGTKQIVPASLFSHIPSTCAAKPISSPPPTTRVR